LDGQSAAALSITRSAGKAGHWVAVGANGGLFAPAKLSRYCRAILDYPVSTAEPAAFIHSILEFARGQACDLVIPVTDWTLGPISAQRERFAGISKVAMPSQAALEFASDKFRTIELAKSIGISVPSTVLLPSVNDLSRLQSTAYPVVVKDRFSARWIDGKAVLGSVKYANSAEELRTRVIQRIQAAGDVLTQEFVAGVGIGFSCFVAEGKAYLPFQWERVRESDPRGSASCARKSIPLDASVASLSQRLVLAMGFEGIAMVEYKRAADGRLILMEVNGRPWGSIGLPVASGIDYPRFLIEWWLQGSVPQARVAYRENLLCRQIVGELTYLSNVRSGPPANWPLPYPSFWGSLFSLAVPWRPGMCYDDFWFSDSRPARAGIRRWFESRLKKSRN